MITLCLETATARVGIALTRDTRPVAEILLDAPGGQQNRLLIPALQQLLSDCGIPVNQIDLFACAAGPGSFTGVRTGIAAVQGLALAQGKPCVGVSSLAMLAMNLPGTGLTICPMLDARKNEVYTALYQVNDQPVALVEDCVAPPAELLRQISSPTLFIGDGAQRYRDLIIEIVGSNACFAPSFLSILRPSAGCLLAEIQHSAGQSLQPEQLLPRYLRLSEAELSRQQKF